MESLAKFASPYNWMSADFQDSRRKIQSVGFHDLTLEGDGEEMAGVRIGQSDAVEIAKRLCNIGVRRLSVLGNSPRPSAAEIATAERIVRLGLDMNVGAFVKTQHEIEIAARLGLWGVTILVSVNEALFPRNVSGSDVIARSAELGALARSSGLSACFMAMDATRTRPEYLKRVIEELDPFYDEYTIADSLGVASPFGLRFLIEQVTTWTRKPIQAHLHNHSSVAIANALAAVLGGASILHTTVNGIGEFAGLLPLEEVAVALAMHLDVASGLQLHGMKQLSEYVSRATGVPISPQKPGVGAYAFKAPETEDIQKAFWELSQAGISEKALPYPPEFVGNEFELSIGRKCNEYTVRYNLWRLGYRADDAAISKIVEIIQRTAENRTGYYTMDPSEFAEIVKTQPI